MTALPLISGFTFVRDGVKFGYPFIESIHSLLPLVDELIVVVGRGSDGTLEQLQELAREFTKIKIHESVWDEQLRKDGAILAQQTDLALSYCVGDWGIYLQADEVLHEEDYLKIRESIYRANENPGVDGLLFDYVHFYADFFVVNRSPSAYRHEVRAIRLKSGMISWKDAQGFRRKITHGSHTHFEKPRVLRAGARIFHYGWVRPPEVMREKTEAMDRLYHGEGAGTGDNYRYKRIFGLERFTGTHPAAIVQRVAEKRWQVDLMAVPLSWEWGDARKVMARAIERATGWLPFQYKNYELVE